MIPVSHFSRSLQNFTLSQIKKDCPRSECLFAFYGGETPYHKYLIFLQFYNVFLFFWCANFVTALGQMTLAGAFASYYWAFKKPDDMPAFPLCASLGRSLRYGFRKKRCMPFHISKVCHSGPRGDLIDIFGAFCPHAGITRALWRLVLSSSPSSRLSGFCWSILTTNSRVREKHFNRMFTVFYNSVLWNGLFRLVNHCNM